MLKQASPRAKVLLGLPDCTDAQLTDVGATASAQTTAADANIDANVDINPNPNPDANADANANAEAEAGPEARNVPVQTKPEVTLELPMYIPKSMRTANPSLTVVGNSTGKAMDGDESVQREGQENPEAGTRTRT